MEREVSGGRFARGVAPRVQPFSVDEDAGGWCERHRGAVRYAEALEMAVAQMRRRLRRLSERDHLKANQKRDRLSDSKAYAWQLDELPPDSTEAIARWEFVLVCLQERYRKHVAEDAACQQEPKSARGSGSE